MSAPRDYSTIPEIWDAFDQIVRHDRRQRRRKRLILVLLVTAVVTSLICIGAALAHDAPPSQMQPLGWQYGWDCCSMTDCRPLVSGAVAETPQGYLIKLTGEVIPYGDKRLKQSKDEFYHQCTHGGDPNDKHSICLYTPDRGY